MKNLLVIAALISIFGCGEKKSSDNNSCEVKDTVAEQKAIAALLDSFNLTAANADYNRYFSYYSDDAIFIGTDPTEHWTKSEFMVWAKPYFDKKKTWNFTAINRHIYFGRQPEIAWFDELLSTQMKICRGSGVVVRSQGQWKVQQYVLSVTVPNSLVDSMVSLKAAVDDSLMTTQLP